MSAKRILSADAENSIHLSFIRVKSLRSQSSVLMNKIDDHITNNRFDQIRALTEKQRTINFEIAKEMSKARRRINY